ncbi:hypothetical protein GS415_00690 [Rhodococcus hoagii]|nr:hypothetical protein [Prescottella equi]
MDRLTAAEVNKKFIYFNVGTPNRPVNPAIAKILRGSRLRAYMRSIGTEAQILFSATAVKGKRPNPQRNSRLVRSRTHLGAVAGKNGLLGPPIVGSRPSRRMPDIHAHASSATSPEASSKAGLRNASPHTEKSTAGQVN